MGAGSSTSSRPNTGEVSDDDFKLVKNWEGEVIGRVPRTQEEKRRRIAARKPKTPPKKTTPVARKKTPPRIVKPDSDSDKSKKGYPNSLRRPSLAGSDGKNSRRGSKVSNGRRGSKDSRRGSRSRSRNRSDSDDDSDEDSDDSRKKRGRKNSKSKKGGRRSSRNSSRNFSRGSFSGYDSGSGSGSGSDNDSDDEDYGRLARYKPVRRYPKPNPTLLPKRHFNLRSAVEGLHKAFKGMGTNEKAVIDILGDCSSDQRQEIVEEYMEKYEQDLVKVIHSELSGNFEDICVALLTDDLDFDIESLKLLLDKENRHMALIGLLSRTSAPGLKLIKKKYTKKYKTDLIKSIGKESNGAFEEVFKSIFSESKERDKAIDHDMAQRDAEELVRAQKKKEKFKIHLRHLISHRNANQVREVCEAFRQINPNKKELTEVTKGLYGQKASIPYNAFLEACDDSDYFFAGCLHHCFDGIGTDNVTLIRLIVSRSEIDLKDIIEAYYDMFGKELADEIEKGTSGDFEKMLLKIMGED